MWQDYNDIDPKDPGESVNSRMTAHHYRLLPRHFLGFALKVKFWSKFKFV